MTDQEIIPGLMGLNMNILHAVDMHMIEDAKRVILKSIEKEHPIVSNVQKNLIALLKTRIPREKYQAKKDLEKILTQFPKHLNSLADLEEMYRDQHLTSDANRCRSKIEEILISTNVEDMKAKQTCLLEQGYIILIERTLVNENTIELRISDMQRILKTEFEKSDGTRRECLERGLHHQVQVLRNVEKANEDNTADGHLVRKGSSLEKFEAAEKLSNMQLPHCIWIFYHAKALNQYYDSLELLSKYKNNMEEDLSAITIKAIEKFWKMIQMKHGSGSKLTKFIARSYAYIGHILTKRCNLLRSASDFKLQEDPGFKAFLHNPLAALQKAYEMTPNDVTVLNRFGRSLWNISSQQKDVRQKQKYLEEANKILTEGERDRDWFTFSTRMIVRLNLADVVLDKKYVWRYLHSAREDGLICFESKTTRRDTSVLAEVCQKLAKFPFTHEYGPENVKNKGYLYEALDFLEYATHMGDPPDYHWTNRTASCLYDLGEYEQAIEWQRKTLFLSEPSSSRSFYIICLFMLTMFERKNIWDQSTDHVLREFLYIIIYAKTKYPDISNTIKTLYRKKKSELLKVIRRILENPLGLRKDEKDVLNYCLEIFLTLSTRKTNKNYSEIQKLMAKLKDVNPGSETDYELSEIFQGKSLKPLIKSVKPWSKDYKYDFFVSHCHKDGNWVENILLRHLESKFDNNDVAFKGCVADRDFTPGISVLDNIIEAINNSNKVILVLTERFVSSNWCQYEADQAMMRSLNSKIDNCVIPVLLEECDIPQKVSLLNYVDLTIQKDICREMRRLKMALLPGRE